MATDSGRRPQVELSEAASDGGIRELSLTVDGNSDAAAEGAGAPKRISLPRLWLACIVAAGVQYGWALQLSLLTPYVQTLGLSHAISSIIWLCGPIAGFVVQPCVGYWSDKCTSRFGRRRPFIFTGCTLISIAVLVVGFSSDIGAALGDTKEHCSVYHGPRWHAAIVYVLGFWLLDFSNNTVQGPARALIADLSGAHGCNVGNAIFCAWMALGNILGYASGSTDKWHQWLPFLKTNACCEACANLKGAFLLAVVFLLLTLTVTLIFAKEEPFIPPTVDSGCQAAEEKDGGPFAVFKNLKNLPPGMVPVLIVTALTWFSWFPFLLYDTDWMGREVYHGDPKGTVQQIDAYNRGVRQGAFGLLLNSIVLGISSFLLEPLCRRVGARVVWAGSNIFMSIAMAATAIISAWSLKTFHGSVQQAITANKGVEATSILLFALMGAPLAVLYSIPFAVTAQLVAEKKGGQGLSVGILNLAIVVPQIIVSLGAGPWDAVFHKGNIPAFALASVAAMVCGIIGLVILPRLSRSQFQAVAGVH